MPPIGHTLASDSSTILTAANHGLRWFNSLKPYELEIQTHQFKCMPAACNLQTAMGGIFPISLSSVIG